MNFINIYDMITSIYSEPLIHLTTKITKVTHTGPWDDKYCPVVQINILLSIITAMLHSRANFTELDCNKLKCLICCYTIIYYSFLYLQLA